MSTEHFLYLVTRGRKTGKPREIEIWYVELGGTFYVIAEKRDQAHWVKNVRACSDVTVSVGSRVDQESHVRRTAARARIIDDAMEREVAQQVRKLMEQSTALVTGSSWRLHASRREPAARSALPARR